jgi:hypothetical protein
MNTTINKTFNMSLKKLETSPSSSSTTVNINLADTTWTLVRKINNIQFKKKILSFNFKTFQISTCLVFIMVKKTLYLLGFYLNTIDFLFL